MRETLVKKSIETKHKHHVIPQWLARFGIETEKLFEYLSSQDHSHRDAWIQTHIFHILFPPIKIIDRSGKYQWLVNVPIWMKWAEPDELWMIDRSTVIDC